MKPLLDSAKLKAWFIAEKRELPWRANPTPYAVWISEVMLQQTQVAVVIPYFESWMRQFPTIEALAQASLDEVIKAWEGLGYYSRARHLHEGAQTIVAHFNGQLPASEEALKKIKGLGPYTIGAILSFAFHQKKAAVDGNVLRVLARYFKIEEDVAKGATIKRLRVLAESILPDQESWVINEALIELGATICQKKARCRQCPLQQSCLAFRAGVVDELPVRSKRPATTYLHRAVAVLVCKEHYLVRRGKKGEIMFDLHEFPYFEMSSDFVTEQQLQKLIDEQLGVASTLLKKLQPVQQGFTRYQVELMPVLFAVQDTKPIADFEWKSKEELLRLAFSSGHRKIWQQLIAD